MLQPSYQLTSHRLGSVKEVWTVSWPIILALLSTCLTLFIDRILLARVSISCLNAAVHANTAWWTVMYLPFAIAGISDVLVGRFHGEGQWKSCGRSAWQMIWFSFLVSPLLYAISTCIPGIFFKGTGNDDLETLYFQTLLSFAPIYCIVSALTGFFIGTGSVRVVTCATVCGNILNIIFDCILIFGWKGIPAYGVRGSAIATGLAQLFQLVFLSSVFVSRSSRNLYGTTDYSFDFKLMLQGLKIGLPAGLSNVFEMASQLIFFRIIILSGQVNFSIVVLCRSFYDLLSFFTEGLYRGVVAITSNLIGGFQWACLGKVIRSATIVYGMFFSLLVGIWLAFPDTMLEHFFAVDDRVFFEDAQFCAITKKAFIWMALAYLLDGFSWIFLAQLVAAGDTRFVFLASSLLNWVGYIAPAYIMVYFFRVDVDMAIVATAFCSAATAFVYFKRLYSKAWLKSCQLGRYEKTIFCESPPV